MNSTIEEQIRIDLHHVCMDGAKFPLPFLELVVVPINPKDMPSGFLDTAREEQRARYRNPGDDRTTLLRGFDLVHRFIQPKSQPGRQSTSKGWFRAGHDAVPETQAVVTPVINGSEKEFGVLLETFSLRREHETDTGELTAGEEAYLKFMNQAGTVLLAYKMVSARDPVSAWLTFLVQHLWESGQLKVNEDGQRKVNKAGYATIGNLWEHSLVALNRLRPEMESSPNANTNKLAPPEPAKNGPVSPKKFVWNEKVAVMQPAAWRLLAFMWDKDDQDAATAYRIAVEDDQKDGTESAINSMIYKVNTALLSVEYTKALTKPKNVNKILWK